MATNEESSEGKYRGEIERVLNERQGVINKLEEAGVEPKAALDALLGEAQYVISVRLADLDRPALTEKAEINVINAVTDFGFDPHNKESLVKAKEAILDLQEAKIEHEE